MNHLPTPASRRYVVMGVSGCGKSAVGKLLAQRLGVDYVEGDDDHPPENIAKMAAGRALDDVDRYDWLARLRDRIADARSAHRSLVLTCSALKHAYRDLLRQGDSALVFLHLDGSRALIATRMAARANHFMPSTLLESQFRDLQPLRETETGSRFDIDKPEAAIVDDMLAWMDARLPHPG
jgi:gluconokinase